MHCFKSTLLSESRGCVTCACKKKDVHQLAFTTQLICPFLSTCENKAHMSCIVRKPDFCLCENKGADQLRGSREADQRLCFRYTDSTLPLLFKSEISSFQPTSVTVQPALCQTWSETPKIGFIASQLIYKNIRAI